ncbi:serine/threonine transporter [Anaerovibrio lipolyticus DSM 3074]|uniref:Serine/threonine transporter SstT n=1 Tax=Anaerovibrio lipolyticus DSM 3074 TaxID=1120997 RepID=A0A1M6BFU7_9FIRM|nr:serine/threonine transporter SstT [Anaerovibrio lipolyticus]SHI47547.1 serine/threonine transporter [Anaerovibrio lipolyticus DSM 3074]
MVTAFRKWQSISLILRIVCGLVVGILLALAMPDNGVVPIFGNLFVGLLKGIAPILVFILVISALANASGDIGGRFKTVMFLYVTGTLLAAAAAVCFSFAMPVGMVLTDAATNTPPGGIGEVIKTILTNMVANPVAALMNANYVGILCWAIIFGMGFKKLASEGTREMVAEFAAVVSRAVTWIIQLAPFGIMGLVYSAVSENGMSIFVDYGMLLVVLVGTMFLMTFIVNPLIVFMFLKKNPFSLTWKCLRTSGVTAFFTRSSAANIPVNMELCKELGLDEDFYSVSVPLGATINMEGAAITITVMTLAVAHTLGIQVDIPTAIILSVLATVGACGASGVAGGSLLLIPMACSLFGISNDIAMQAVGVGFIIGVIQDSCETALNSSTDALFAATAEFKERLDRGEEVNMNF